jgi:CRP/FNR family nitrogen fixation transcriptional regulator
LERSAQPFRAWQPALAPVAAGPTRQLGTLRSSGKDEEIYGQGDAADHFFKINSGAVRTGMVLDDGRRQIDAFYGPGDIFGIEAGSTHRFFAEAVTDVVLTSFRSGSAVALSNGAGLAPAEIAGWALRQLERAQEHAMLLGCKSALEKVAAFLVDMAERLSGGSFDLPMCRADIADYLGLTIETVSRTLTQLERDRIIALPAGRRTIVLRNAARLRHLAA